MKFLGAAILWALIFSFSPVGQVRGDWVKGVFSPAAKIDSLNRFLIMHDLRDSTLFGRIIIPAGDQNGDGIADFIACRAFYSNIFDDTTFLCYGGAVPQSTPAKRLDGFNYSSDNIGDVNGDGVADFGQWYFWTEPNSFEIRLGGSHMAAPPWGSFPGVSNLPRGTKATQFDTSGQLLLALIPDQYITGTVRIYEVAPIFDTIPKYVIHDTAKSFADNLAVADFNGDGYEDLAVAAAYNRVVPFVEFYWGGPNFDTVPDFVIRYSSGQFGKTLLPLGDFNGDGFEDILIAGGANDRYGIYFGGPLLDSVIDIVVDNGGPFSYQPPTCASVGDFNHDHHPDVIVGYQGLSYDDSYFKIFLGGPDGDSLPDVKFNAADLLVRDTGFVDLVGFGSEVSSVGDFNADGIDDFAVYSKTDNCCHWWAEISLFAGWNSNPTDANPDHTKNLPTSFTLHPPYPNPFNPSTTISFDLPKRSSVKLIVYDLLGREVRKLADKEMSAGTHSITWDGTTATGKPAASGTYFFKLTSDGVTKSVKGMLLK